MGPVLLFILRVKRNRVVGEAGAAESDGAGQAPGLLCVAPEWLSGCPLCPQVCERPPVFLLDTPGVLAPRIGSVETGLKLALCGEPGARARPCRPRWPCLSAQPCPARPRPIPPGRRGALASWALTGRPLPGTVLDHLVGEETLADYLLYTLNRHRLLG